MNYRGHDLTGLRMLRGGLVPAITSHQSDALVSGDTIGVIAGCIRALPWCFD
jgi:hypothetical protein